MHGVHWKEAMRKRDIQKREARTEEKAQILGGQNVFNVEKENPYNVHLPCCFFFYS